MVTPTSESGQNKGAVQLLLYFPIEVAGLSLCWIRPYGAAWT